MTPTESDLSFYISDLKKEFPKLKIHTERPSWMKTLFRLMFWNEYDFWDGFTTTIGMNIYLAPEWNNFSPRSQLSILRHEREHLKQFKKFTLPLMAIIYLFLPLPCYLALGRAHFEKAGYDESIRALKEYNNLSEDTKDIWREWYIKHFTGSSYFWMFPFKSIVGKWFDKVWSETSNPSSD